MLSLPCFGGEATDFAAELLVVIENQNSFISGNYQLGSPAGNDSFDHAAIETSNFHRLRIFIINPIKGQENTTLNRNLELRYPKHLNSVFYFILLGVLFAFAVVPMLEAAIVPTGNVEPGGTWTSSTIGYVGNISDGSLLVDAGSSLLSSAAYIAYNSGESGMVTITGAGTKWTNRNHLCIGNSGTGVLRVEAGGKVSNSFAILGYYAGSSGTVTITGTGSMWANSNELLVGRGGIGTLTVTDGGIVTAGTLYASLSNLLGNGTITAQGAVLDADLQFNAAHPKQVSVSFGSGGTLAVTAGEGALGAGYKGNGSLTITEGVAVTSSYDGYLGYYTGSYGIATVSGIDSTWTNQGYLYVGRSGTGALRIVGGGQVSNSDCILGYYAGSSGTANVTGTGSKWTNSSSLYVGYSGTGTLTVVDGGTVTTGTLYASLSGLLGNGTITATQGAVLDADIRFDAAHPTKAIVSFDSGGTLTVTAGGGTLGAGYKGIGNLTIADGVTVTSPSGYLGYHAGSSGIVLVTSSGSAWTNRNALYVGNYGSGTLRIEAGGQVNSSEGYLGRNSSSSGTVTVTGIDSKWINSSTIYVGNSGVGTLRIEAGGQVSTTIGYLGFNSGSSGTATVTGAGSMWTISDTLYVGRNGTGTLTVADGGVVTTKTLYASLESLHGNGTVTATRGAVLDADLRFDAAHTAQTSVEFGSGGTLTINAAGGVLGSGYKGNGSLTVAEGVTVTSSTGYLGYNSGSSGTATVTGTGTTWTSSSLVVGNNGFGTLRIEAGGQVSNTISYLGYNSGSSGTATVTGAGSMWTISDTLYVEGDGTGTLTVADGGVVFTKTLYASLGSLYGNGTITATNGAVLDADLRFDATHPAQNALAFGSGGTLWVTVTASGNLGAGYKGNGSLTVAEGVTVTSSTGYIGYNSGSSGMATVTGIGSKWTNSSSFFIGNYGTGMLRIEAGGQVSNSNGYLGHDPGSTGTATVTGAGSSWTNSGDIGVGLYGNGTLRIEAGGQVSSSGGYIGELSGSSGTATVTGAGSKWTNSSSLYVGNSGLGMLRIEAGGLVSSSTGYIGNTLSYSSGSVTVTGIGSKWTITNYLSIGGDIATLHIEAGGNVSNSSCSLGGNGSYGTATITDTGSIWTNTGSLSIGSGCTMFIQKGGLVTAGSVAMSSNSQLTLDVGYGSKLQIGNGTGRITNDGKIRILTGPQSAAGSQYSPIAAITWMGSGAYQAIGGTWNTTSHAFTVSQTVTGTSGTPVAIDLAQRQRVLVNDSTNDWSVGSSFLAKTGTGNSFDFTATAVAGTDLSTLNGLLEPGQSVLSGWNLAAVGSGYIASDPVYVSLGIPAILSHGNVQLWRFNSGSWNRFTADDLTANDGYASFTSIGLSNYAVSAALPVAAWKADANGLWQTGTNWTTDPNAPGGVNVAALLGSAISGPRTVTLGGAMTLGTLTLDSAQHYTLSGMDSLSMQVNPGFTTKIDVQKSDAQGHVIETPLTVSSPLEIAVAPSACLTLSGEVQNPAGKTLTLTGGGTLTVMQGLVTTGAINVEAGTLNVTSLRAGTLTIGGGSVSALATVPEPSSLFLLLAATVAIVGRLLIAKK